LTTKGKRRSGAGFGERPTGVRRVAIYVRRSTDQENQPFSLDAQLNALRSYVASQPGWQLVGEPFSDDASGATTERPDLQRALRAARAGRFDVLLVYRVDRFSRRLSDLLDLLNELDGCGVAFASATEPFDTSTAIGRMLVQLLGVFAEFERETIIDRITEGMAAKARKGKWSGGRPPYGYRVDRDTQKLVPNPTEAPILTEVIRLYADLRLGTRAIADELNERGIPHRYGNKWSCMIVSRIIANPAYVGDIVQGEIIVPDAHPALVDRDTWGRVRRIADARAKEFNQQTLGKSDFCLSGLIVCPECGSRYFGTTATGRNRTYSYYTCYSRARYSKHGCQAPRLDATAADAAALHAVSDFFRDAPGMIGTAVARAQERSDSGRADRHAELDVVEDQIASKTAAVDRYRAAFEKGTMDDETAGDRIKELQREIRSLTARRDELADAIEDEPGMPEPATLDLIRDAVTAVLTNGDTASRKALFEALIGEVRILPEGRLVPVFKVPGPGQPLRADQADSDEPSFSVRQLPRLVEVAGIEPASSGDSTGLLRAQLALPLLGPTGLASKPV
jgi:site-specific DNA recombinase